MGIWGKVCSGLVSTMLVMGPAVDSVFALDAGMTQMFNSWGLASVSSPPTAFQGQTRNAYTGGSLEMRFQNQPMSLATISPPRMSVGCGGVDVYLGGFSYGSLSRYVDLLTQMGTGAVLGYAFQLAMKFICPDCADVLNKLEAAARALNTAARLGPCSAGEAVKAAMKAGESLSALGTSAVKAYEGVLETNGRIRDAFENRDVRVGQTVRDAVNDMISMGADPTGNLVWKALGAVTPLPSNDTRTLIMSLFGTIIVDANGIPHYHPPTLEYKTVMDLRSTETVEILTCLDGPTNCIDVTEGPSTAGSSGFQEKVQTSLDAIVTGIQTGVAPSAADIAFINTASTPVYRLLLDYGKTNAMRMSIVEHAKFIVADQLAFYYITHLRRELVKHVLHFKKTNPDFAGDAEGYLLRLTEVYQTFLSESGKRNTLHQASYNYLEHFRSNPPTYTRR